jgi:hypothetical protein
MKQDIRTFLVGCDVFQCNKGETVKASGTLQLLLIPPAIWRDISMDFIVGLSKSGNKCLCLQPYKKTSLKVEHCQKIAPKFYGPYTTIKRLGHVAYQLALPSHSKIHHVFHVSCLNKVIGTKCQTQTNIPELDE